MRKPLGILLALVALFFVASCGASGGDESSDTTEAETSEESSTTEDETTTTADDSSDAVEVDAWAEDFCGNFQGWLSEIQDASGTVSEGITPGDVEGAKAAIVGLFDDASTSTTALIESLESGGYPDIDDGEDLVDDLVGKFEDFDTAIGGARAEAEALPTDDPAAFQSGVNDVVETFQTEVTEVGDSFSELDTKYPAPELSSALEASCTEL